MPHIINMDIAPPEQLIIELRLGNHSIDELVGVFNRNFLFEFTVGYLERTNTLHFSTKKSTASS